MTTDVITEEVIRARIDGIMREMQAAVMRTGFSTIIRESHDFSAGITDKKGATVGQHAALLQHRGAYPDCVRGILEFYSIEEMRDGDCFLASHPYYSGSPHPNDMVVVSPVVFEDEVVAFCSSMGHKSDIGGQSPGSRNALARDIFGEGLVIAPVLFQREREPVPEVAQFLIANSRTPDLVIGDLNAQAGAMYSIGAKRIKELMATFGKAVVLDAFEKTANRTETRVKSAISQWHDGIFEAEGFVDDIVNRNRPVRIHVAVQKKNDRVVIDFSGSDDQSLGPINVRPPFIHGMAHFALIAMIDPTIPGNSGVENSIEWVFREGSIVNPTFPAPTGFYSMTIPVVEDVLFEAISQLAGKPIVAHNAPPSMVVFGSTALNKGRKYVQYELLRSGNGAYEGGDGWTGTAHSASGGSKFTSIEIIESEFNIEVTKFRIIPDSGGAGLYRGGNGLVREYRVHEESRYAGGNPRNLLPPQGVSGGHSGTAGGVVINPGTTREEIYTGLISNVLVREGDIVQALTSGAGGVGDPKLRPQKAVINDLMNGYITDAAAINTYGLDPKIANEVTNIDGKR
ncbi:MAG: hydantoinase B/oxoprolinase family protein [Dehalococcoidia bacterium]|nr:hydantoinase B/oxoprolinase family protein [Dehalococcoidia bacterium]